MNSRSRRDRPTMAELDRVCRAWYQPPRQSPGRKNRDNCLMFDEHPRRHLRRHWAVFAGLVVALVIWCAVDVRQRAVIDPERPYLHMTDFTVYTEAGAAFYSGGVPYDVTNARGWKYLYPPLFALLVAPLSRISAPDQATVWF